MTKRGPRKGYAQTPEHRAAIGAGNRRGGQRAAAIRRWENPEYREHQRQGRATSDKLRLMREDTALRALERDSLRYACKLCGEKTMKNPDKKCPRCQTHLPRPGACRNGRRGLCGDGYVRVNTPKGKQLEHRAVAGLAYGDPRIAHHRDGDKSNNDPSNLRVFATNGDHSRHHALERAEARRSAVHA